MSTPDAGTLFMYHQSALSSVPEFDGFKPSLRSFAYDVENAESPLKGVRYKAFRARSHREVEGIREGLCRRLHLRQHQGPFKIFKKGVYKRSRFQIVPSGAK